MVVVGANVTLSIGFFSWIAAKVIENGRLIAMIEARISARDEVCHNREEWLKRMDSKLDLVVVDVATIKGALAPSGVVALRTYVDAEDKRKG